MTTGCWDRQELNTIGISGVIGIEKTNNTVNLSMEIYNPKTVSDRAGKTGESAKYVQSTGQSFFDAIRNITMVFDKKIFFAHVRELIISEETARNGLADLLDLYLREHEPWPNTYLIISKGVRPAEVIGIKGGIEDTTANYLEDLINNNDYTGKTVRTSVIDFLKDYYDKDSSAVGIITRKGKADASEEGKGKYELEAEGAAVFSKQKLAGFLDGIETRGMNFAAGKIKSAIIVSPTIDGNGKNSVEVIRSDRKISTFIDGNRTAFHLNINITGMLGEETGRPDTDQNPEIIKAIAEKNSEVVKQEVEHVIKRAQKEFHLDIFGFGQALHREYPRQWKDMKSHWNEIFPNVEITVSVNTDIKHMGLINTPVERKSTEQ